MDDSEDSNGLHLKPETEVKPALAVYYENEDDDGGWIEELLENDELSDSEAAFLVGYWSTEREGFE